MPGQLLHPAWEWCGSLHPGNLIHASPLGDGESGADASTLACPAKSNADFSELLAKSLLGANRTRTLESQPTENTWQGTEPGSTARQRRACWEAQRPPCSHTYASAVPCPRGRHPCIRTLAPWADPQPEEGRGARASSPSAQLGTESISGATAGPPRASAELGSQNTRTCPTPRGSHMQGGQGEPHSSHRAGVSGEGPLQSPSPPALRASSPERVARLSPHHAEVHAVGDGVSPVLRTSPLMPPSVPSRRMAAVSLGLPSSLSITTCNRAKHQATGCSRQKPPHGHCYGTIRRVLLQTDVEAEQSTGLSTCSRLQQQLTRLRQAGNRAQRSPAAQSRQGPGRAVSVPAQAMKPFVGLPTLVLPSWDPRLQLGWHGRCQDPNSSCRQLPLGDGLGHADVPPKTPCLWPNYRVTQAVSVPKFC